MSRKPPLGSAAAAVELASAPGNSLGEGDAQIGGDVVAPPAPDQTNAASSSPVPDADSPADAEHRLIEAAAAVDGGTTIVGGEATEIAAETEGRELAGDLPPAGPTGGEPVEPAGELVSTGELVTPPDPRLAEWEAQRASLLSDTAAALEARDAAEARAEQAEAALAAAGGDEIAKLKRELATARAAKPKAARPKKVGALDDAPDVEALGKLLRGDAELAISFSDGTHAIEGFDPVDVTEFDWSRREGRWLLTKPIQVSGTGLGAAGATIAGFGLVNGEGKQIAWSALPDPLHVAPGTRHEFRDSVIF